MVAAGFNGIKACLLSFIFHMDRDKKQETGQPDWISVKGVNVGVRTLPGSPAFVFYNALKIELNSTLSALQNSPIMARQEKQSGCRSF